MRENEASMNNKNNKVIERKSVSEIEFAVYWLSSIMNVAIKKEMTFTDVLKIYEAGGKDYQLLAEKVTMKSIQTLLHEIVSHNKDSFTYQNIVSAINKWEIHL